MKRCRRAMFFDLRRERGQETQAVSINISFLRNEESKMLPMDGVLIIDKPAGMTSHDVVARVRKMIGERRIGHTGTLDPFATGVLVLLVGRATRIAQFLSTAEKEYEGVIR